MIVPVGGELLDSYIDFLEIIADLCKFVNPEVSSAMTPAQATNQAQAESKARAKATQFLHLGNSIVEATKLWVALQPSCGASGRACPTYLCYIRQSKFY